MNITNTPGVVYPSSHFGGGGFSFTVSEGQGDLELLRTRGTEYDNGDRELTTLPFQQCQNSIHIVYGKINWRHFLQTIQCVGVII